MRKLILFGDSNTYGYDPRSFLGGRYPENVRWATVVKNALIDSFEVIEEGMNGRTLPSAKPGLFTDMISNMDSNDTMAMMLGTNDILLAYRPNVAATLSKLKQILDYVNTNCKGTFVLIAPPYISNSDPELSLYHDCCIELNKGYISLAQQYNIAVVDAASWNIPMGSDGVHFSEEGHRVFAERFLNSLITC